MILNLKFTRFLFLLFFSIFFCLFISNFSVSAATPRFNFINIENQNGGRVFYDDLKVGDKITGTLRLILGGDQNAIFEVHFEDSYYKKLKKQGLDDASIEKLSLVGSMNLFDNNVIVLGPGESKDIPFELLIPEGVSPGDYNSYFIVSLLNFGKDRDFYLNSKIEDFTSGTKISLGIGIEYLFRIAGDFKPNLKLTDLDYFVDDEGHLRLLVSYINEGNIAIIPKSKILITDIFGRRYFNSDFKFSVIQPHQEATSSMMISLDDFKFNNGIYNVDLDLFYAVYNWSYSSEELVYDSGKGRLRIYSIPSYVFIFLFSILFLVLGRIFYKNYTYIRLYKYSKSYLVKDRDTLQSVSNKFKVNPKHVIILNKLKNPYFLNIGDKILIPKKNKNEKK